MNLIEKLSKEDIAKINNYVSYYGGANGEFMGAEKWLEDWNDSNKKLYKLLGNNLILSIPFSYEKTQEDKITENNSKIKKLQEDKDLLVQANANLLGKIPMGKADDEDFGESKKETDPQFFDYRTVFQNGRFKR